MSSNPPGQCCTVGVKHEGSATGKIDKLGQYPAYFAYPKDQSTDNAILFLTDVIGYDFINAQLVADQFAANGYFVAMPDLFNGDPVKLNRPEGFDIMSWLQNGTDNKGGHLPPQVDPIVTESIKELRTKFHVKNLGAVGYCFGAKYVVRFLGQIGKETSATLDAGYVAHPSFVDDAELREINGPLSIAAAETDQIFPEEKRHASEKILKELSAGPKSLAWQINLYSHVEHGFSIRTDVSDAKKKFAKEQAFIQAVQWFDAHLKDAKK